MDQEYDASEDIGSRPATRASVRDYLLHEGVSEANVDGVLDEYAEEIEKGEQRRSFAYYVGDTILRKLTEQ